MSTLPPLASLGGFLTRYSGVVATADAARVAALLDDASALVREVAGSDYVDDDGALDDVPAVLAVIVTEVARRAYDNPQALTGETVGNYSWRGARTTGSSLYLTTDERRTVRRVAGKLCVGTVDLEGYLPVINVDDPVGELYGVENSDNEDDSN